MARFRRLCATAVIGVLACGHETPTRPVVPGIAIVSSRSIGDTIGTVISDPIVATVTENGVPVGGVDVEVRCDMPADCTDRGVFFQQTPGPFVSDSLTLLTDPTGHVQFYVWLGDHPGTYHVRIAVPQLGLVDGVTVTVRAGRAARIAFGAPDTAATVGASYSLGVRVLDRLGDVTAEAVAVATSNPAVATFGNTDSLVRAVAIGRTYLTATVNGVRDSAWISVVPPGRLLAFRGGAGDQTGFYMFNTDGSVFRVFTTTNYAYNNRSQTSFRLATALSITTAARVYLRPDVDLGLRHERQRPATPWRRHERPFLLPTALTRRQLDLLQRRGHRVGGVAHEDRRHRWSSRRSSGRLRNRLRGRVAIA